jgi:hypothetical protein
MYSFYSIPSSKYAKSATKYILISSYNSSLISFLLIQSLCVVFVRLSLRGRLVCSSFCMENLRTFLGPLRCKVLQRLGQRRRLFEMRALIEIEYQAAVEVAHLPLMAGVAVELLPLLQASSSMPSYAPPSGFFSARCCCS